MVSGTVEETASLLNKGLLIAANRHAHRSEAAPAMMVTACVPKAYLPRGLGQNTVYFSSVLHCGICCYDPTGTIALAFNRHWHCVELRQVCSRLTWLLCSLQTMPPRRKGDREEDEGLCSICMDRPLEAQISGCDHQVLLPSDLPPLL